jgi:hypothetical protein
MIGKADSLLANNRKLRYQRTAPGLDNDYLALADVGYNPMQLSPGRARAMGSSAGKFLARRNSPGRDRRDYFRATVMVPAE